MPAKTVCSGHGPLPDVHPETPWSTSGETMEALTASAAILKLPMKESNFQTAEGNKLVVSCLFDLHKR